MPLHQTPFDHIGLWSPSVRLLPFLQGTCFVLIEAARFAMSSLLIVLGVLLLRAPRFLRRLETSLASPRAQEADHG